MNFSSEGSHDARDAGVQTESLFDAALEVLHAGHVLRRAHPLRVAEDVVHLVREQLLLLRMPGHAVEKPAHGCRSRIVSLRNDKTI